ncbi:hypothetical protein BESB_001640 [Besnoitia besnoiti]|uniref:Uncharacterized protein n=1 Tax=Besnoitia besnoiti TaxID=94643 RepID=A0A2A9MPQ4_BESBE|nr:hypothetical protein BESB_001640 [Besnoitia besnoiti]PFH37822.1 hypothetical protein BESB_001640 [Besnoitia besnoiti]
MAAGGNVGSDLTFHPECEVGSTATSPLDNLRCLERLLDVTYSSVCCKLNAGTIPLVVRFPRIFQDEAECPSREANSPDGTSVGSESPARRLSSVASEASEGLADIFGRGVPPGSLTQSADLADLPLPPHSSRSYAVHNVVSPPVCSCLRDARPEEGKTASSHFSDSDSRRGVACDCVSD